MLKGHAFSYNNVGDIMLRTKALRKIFITTLSLFVLLVAFSIPNMETSNVLRTNLEIEEVSSLSTNSIYLLNKDGYLVKSRIFIDSSDKREQIAKILSNLTINSSNSFSNGLSALIPKGTVVREIIYGQKLVTVNFSKKILKVTKDMEKQMVAAIVYSIMDLGDIKGVSILVEGESLLSYPNSGERLPSTLDRSIGINKSYDITSRDNISKVVIYYITQIDGDKYYVPVTKYLNDEREKIKIIVEELTTSYIHEANLMSFLNSNVALLDYKEENNVMFLNFNDYLFDNNDKLLEEVIYSLAYSVFDNYDVNMVMFEVNNEEIRYISKKSLN